MRLEQFPIHELLKFCIEPYVYTCTHLSLSLFDPFPDPLGLLSLSYVTLGSTRTNIPILAPLSHVAGSTQIKNSYKSCMNSESRRFFSPSEHASRAERLGGNAVRVCCRTIKVHSLVTIGATYK